MGSDGFGSRLAAARRKAQLTQEQLAQRLGVSPQAVSKWERGSYPDGALLPLLADALHTSLDALFGRAEPISADRLEQTLISALQELPAEARGARVMELCYAMLCAFSDASSQYRKLPEGLTRETFAELRTDHELALARLNPDLRYFCLLQIPENGIGAYVRQPEQLQRLFSFLADPDGLRMLFLFAATRRNVMLTQEVLLKRLGISEPRLTALVQNMNTLGLIWTVTVEQDGTAQIAYGYSHNTAIAAILTLAAGYMGYIQVREPFIDTMTQGAFRMDAPTEM